MSGAGACRDHLDSILDDQPTKPPTEPRAPRITYACPNCGQVDAHAENCPSNPRAQTATPDDFTVTDLMVAYDLSDEQWDYLPLEVRESLLKTHTTRHNQHTKLVAALRLVAEKCHAENCDKTPTCDCFWAIVARAALAKEPEGEGGR